MIHLFGDVWLGKIATLLREFYPEQQITFADESKDQAFDPATLPEDTTLVVGIVTAAVVGLLSIRVLFAWVRTRSYLPFVIYRFAFAALIVIVWLARN